MGIEIEPPVRLRSGKLGPESHFKMSNMTGDHIKESLKLLEIKPEEVAQAILELTGGAVSTGTLDGILEIFVDMWFPQYVDKPLFGFEPLPPIDDWLVGAAPLLTGVVATQMGNRDLMRVGVGGALYWGAMIVHNMILRAKAYGVGPRSLASTGSPTQGKYAATPRKSVPTEPTKGRYQITNT